MRLLFDALALLALLLGVTSLAACARSYAVADQASRSTRHRSDDRSSVVARSDLGALTVRYYHWTDYPRLTLEEDIDFQRRGVRRSSSRSRLPARTADWVGRAARNLVHVRVWSERQVEEADVRPPPPFNDRIVRTRRVARRCTLALPYWLVAAPSLLWPYVRFSRRRRARRAARRHLCPACGYDLRASPDRCPECGTPAPPPANPQAAAAPWSDPPPRR